MIVDRWILFHGELLRKTLAELSKIPISWAYRPSRTHDTEEGVIAPSPLPSNKNPGGEAGARRAWRSGS
jgi:hypothetical protein